ncbi:hypothetical protein V8E51_019711 [Hyaloscypha variabilis]
MSGAEAAFERICERLSTAICYTDTNHDFLPTHLCDEILTKDVIERLMLTVNPSRSDKQGLVNKVWRDGKKIFATLIIARLQHLVSIFTESSKLDDSLLPFENIKTLKESFPMCSNHNILALYNKFLQVATPVFREGIHEEYAVKRPMPFLEIKEPKVKGSITNVHIITIPAANFLPEASINKFHRKMEGRFTSKVGVALSDFECIILVRKQIGNGKDAEEERKTFHLFHHDCIVPLYCSYTIKELWESSAAVWSFKDNFNALCRLTDALGSIYQVQTLAEGGIYSSIGSHNDMKPDNIIVDLNRKLFVFIDFSFAKITDPTTGSKNAWSGFYNDYRAPELAI